MLVSSRLDGRTGKPENLTLRLVTQRRLKLFIFDVEESA
jgi:hypothetical protein